MSQTNRKQHGLMHGLAPEKRSMTFNGRDFWIGVEARHGSGDILRLGIEPKRHYRLPDATVDDFTALLECSWRLGLVLDRHFGISGVTVKIVAGPQAPLHAEILQRDVRNQQEPVTVTSGEKPIAATFRSAESLAMELPNYLSDVPVGDRMPSSTIGDDIFCRTVLGNDEQTIEKDNGIVAFANRFPDSRFHTLVAPEAHCAWNEMTPEAMHGLSAMTLELGKRVHGAIVRETGRQGQVSIIIHMGSAQTVQHPHIHIKTELPVPEASKGRTTPDPHNPKDREALSEAGMSLVISALKRA